MGPIGWNAKLYHSLISVIVNWVRNDFVNFFYAYALDGFLENT